MGVVEGVVHVGGPGVPPRAAPVSGELPRTFLVQSPLRQFLGASARAFPLPPDKAAQFAPYPPVQFLKEFGDLGVAEIGYPSPQHRGQFGDEAPEVAAASLPEEYAEFRFAPRL